MQKIIVIIGATATKKTTLAIKLAQDINAEIINADAFQVFKELNVGVNKPNKNQLKQVNFHLIDEYSIYDEFDVSIFQKACSKKIDEILKKNKQVILCGGSNLYIDAVIKTYDLYNIPSRQAITYFDKWKYEDIFEYVKQNDPTEADKIGFNNKKRIIRAAQIIYWTNKPKSAQINNQQYRYDCFMIETVCDKDKLLTQVNNRIDSMLKSGWKEEVATLYKKDAYVANLNAFKAIGYMTILQSIINNQPINVSLIQQQTRQYIKKQLTWNRNKYDKITHFDVTNDNYNILLSSVKSFLHNN